jgi:hypothetical protein
MYTHMMVENVLSCANRYCDDDEKKAGKAIDAPILLHIIEFSMFRDVVGKNLLLPKE